MERISMEVGRMYERKDGFKAFCYGYDIVTQQYKVVLLNQESFYTVHEDGRYYATQESHNDLIRGL